MIPKIKMGYPLILWGSDTCWQSPTKDKMPVRGLGDGDSVHCALRDSRGRFPEVYSKRLKGGASLEKP